MASIWVNVWTTPKNIHLDIKLPTLLLIAIGQHSIWLPAIYPVQQNYQNRKSSAATDMYPWQRSRKLTRYVSGRKHVNEWIGYWYKIDAFANKHTYKNKMHLILG